MKFHKFILLVTALLLSLGLSSCGSSDEETPTSEPTIATSTPVPSTMTPIPAPTSTAIVKPTVQIESPLNIPESPLNAPESPLELPPAAAQNLPLIDSSTLPVEGIWAFHSSHEGTYALYKFDGVNNMLTRLTTTDSAVEAEWSPDCENIMYSNTLTHTVDITRGIESSLYTLYLTDQAGSNHKPLFPADVEGFRNELSPPDVWAASWSKNNIIAYQSNGTEDKNFQICFAQPDGTKLGCHETNDGEGHPDWSPDGSQLVYISTKGMNWHVFISDVTIGNGKIEMNNARQLTMHSGIDLRPRFSPDGSKVVFQSKRAATFDIYVINVDGSNEIRLTSTDGEDTEPEWISQSQILFSTTRDVWLDETRSETQTDIFAVDIPASEPKQITQLGIGVGWPTWCKKP